MIEPVISFHVELFSYTFLIIKENYLVPSFSLNNGDKVISGLSRSDFQLLQVMAFVPHRQRSLENTTIRGPQGLTNSEGVT